ncbi:hypothetical protein B7453_29045 [Pseudomonas sp. IB20]|uniref:hypothetical protein n=1 Tax=Pseudomonas TaxID=286 RepID=UPI000BA08A0A|nr:MULTISPECIES: hypothetical protein [unclassified Pseudomonas]MCV2229883.1 hypothetical protein [Pseudomonas sp. AU10]OZO01035.1 hypothetical protein B7453_29045 [Pseudomonas sp. IB20]
MLDIVIHGDKVNNDGIEHWETQDKRIPILAFCAKSASGKLTSQTPRAFDSERTDYIARVYAHDLDLHSDDLLQHARGMKRSPRQGQ